MVDGKDVRVTERGDADFLCDMVGERVRNEHHRNEVQCSMKGGSDFISA